MKNLILSIVIITFLAACAGNTEERPNIILILADDYGFMDTQAYAEKILGTDKREMYYETPGLNRLVEEGIAFSRAYANQLCSPTRAAILTGKYAGRLGFTTATPRMQTFYNTGTPVPEGLYGHELLQHGGSPEKVWINGRTNTAVPAGTAFDKGRDETSLAEALPDYHSAFIGKWHLGGHGAEGYQPEGQGFHPIAWYDAGGSRYFNWRDAWNNRSRDVFPDIPQEELMMGHAGMDTGEEYLTDDLTAQVLNYLDERAGLADRPFFLYFCHFAVHGPWQAKEEDSIYFANKESKGWNGHHVPNYAGMVRSLDSSVGSILDKLEETGLEDNTLVIFMSDNGGLDYRLWSHHMATDNSPLRGGKACLTEGGIRVPLVFRWKGKVDSGKWCDVPVDCTDIFATIIQAAGYDPEPYYTETGIDGRSLLPLLEDIENSKGLYDHDTRYWHYPFNVVVLNPFDMKPLDPHSAIMEGNFKLIFDWQGSLKLFDLETDIGEEHNLASEMPEKTKDLFTKLLAWLESDVDHHYWPTLNPDYDPSKQVRKDAPFVDLYDAYKKGKNIVELAN